MREEREGRGVKEKQGDHRREEKETGKSKQIGKLNETKLRQGRQGIHKDIICQLISVRTKRCTYITRSD